MLLDGDRQTLKAYLGGDRSSENVLAYFRERMLWVRNERTGFSGR